jgi:hypothetical protein
LPLALITVSQSWESSCSKPLQRFQTEKISAYEVQLEDQAWNDFAALNNSLAAEFVTRNQGGHEHFYLLTASTQREYPSLIS